MASQVLQSASQSEMLPNRELVVMLESGSEVSQLGPPDHEFVADDLRQTLKEFNASMHPTFASVLGRTEGFGAPAAFGGGEDLSRFFNIQVSDESMDMLAESLRKLPQVVASYIKPPAEPAAAPAPGATPDFTPRQDYLNSAPAGIDANYAWTLAGGKGDQITIIDIEGDWRFSHEDLQLPKAALAGGQFAQKLDWRNHGTAVLGEIVAKDNGLGVTGICSNANVRVVSIYGWPSGTSTSAAIGQAATILQPGDVMLVEIHRAGPRFAFKPRADQKGYIAVEWWPDDFAAIQFATGRGVLVVEPAGNGAENLDDILYNTPASGFPPGWTNPFNRSNRDSGAIIVGAGAPPPGTHGRQYGPDRSRLDFSNWGDLVDAQGWGAEVTTCGYGTLQGGQTEDTWYTDTFGGTSSASPIIVGALGCLQGIRRAQGKASLTPLDARALLRRTGSPQQASGSAPLSQRIGTRPDLKQLIANMP